jgi:branched-chain amino acid transport system substrate-binding protein
VALPVVGLALLALLLFQILNSGPPPLTIGIAGPFSGPSKLSGQSELNGAQLYIDTLNRQGGVHGRQVRLLRCDDLGSAPGAVRCAQQFAHSSVIAVLGHKFSVASVAAGPIYQAARLPALTGSATADVLTERNPYYFRDIFTNTQEGAMVAHYTQEALGNRTASVVYTPDVYGASLGQSFVNTFAHLGTLKHVLTFE